MLPYCLGDINLLFTYRVIFLISFSCGVWFPVAQVNDVTFILVTQDNLPESLFIPHYPVNHQQLTAGLWSAWETVPSGSDLRTWLQSFPSMVTVGSSLTDGNLNLNHSFTSKSCFYKPEVPSQTSSSKDKNKIMTFCQSLENEGSLENHSESILVGLGHPRCAGSSPTHSSHMNPTKETVLVKVK